MAGPKSKTRKVKQAADNPAQLPLLLLHSQLVSSALFNGGSCTAEEEHLQWNSRNLQVVGSMVDTPVLACLLLVVDAGKLHHTAASSCWPDTAGHNQSMLICLFLGHSCVHAITDFTPDR